MSKNFLKRPWMTAVLAVLASCTVSVGIQEAGAPADGGVCALTADPVCGDDPDTKAIGTDLKFTFSDTDDISIYAATGTTHMVYRLVPDATDAKKATFSSDLFVLKNGTTYYAFYPDKDNNSGASALSVSFTGQAQSGNNSSAHLSPFDYQTASATIADNSGVFQFSHKVSWLKITIQASEAAVLKSVSISADNGVANSAVFDLVEGTVTPSREDDDILTLTLGGSEGISVDAGGTVTAFVTMPSQSYTNLTITAVDAAENRYVKACSGTTTLMEGKYYTLTLLRTDTPENTPFTSLTTFGSYSSTNTESPVSVRVYNDANDQMSYGTSGTGEDWRSFKLVDFSDNSYAIFTIASRTLKVGETYSISYDIDGVTGNTSCKAVKMTSGCVWLEDKTNSKGFIFAIE